MRTLTLFLAALLPAAVLLAEPVEAGVPVERDAAPVAEQVAAPDAAPDSTMLVRVERMGGFAGVHESWTLHASGEVWFMPVPGVAASVVRTLGPDLMDQVRGVLGAGLGRGPVGVPGVECSDCFRYRVVVVGPGATRDIVVGEHRLDEASPELRRLLGLVAGRGPPPFSFPIPPESRAQPGTPGTLGG